MNIIDYTGKIPTNNYSKDRKGYIPEAIVFHITADNNPQQALNWFMDPVSGVSAHYIIEKDGTIEMCVIPLHRAFHAGITNKTTAAIFYDKGKVNPNNYTIGIECVSAGEALTAPQRLALIELTGQLCNTYHIPVDRYHLIGHNELDAVNRSNDPVISYTIAGFINDVLFNKTINYRPICSSPDYWARNAVVGGVVKGDYIKQLILNYVAMYIVAKDYTDALNYLTNKCIIQNPNYWLQVGDKNGEWVRILITNIGKLL